MNEMMVIFPYKKDGTWMFDDEDKGLKSEPFVLGMSSIIDETVTTMIPNASKGFKLIFSTNKFPRYIICLEIVIEESMERHGGNWYQVVDGPDLLKGRVGWLCPAMFKYFPRAPKYIYVKCEPK